MEPILSCRTIQNVTSDDATDWALARSGEGEAFGRIFDRHYDRVFRHGFRLVERPADVEDLVALTFLEAWRRREALRLVDGSALPWLLVTATNVANNLRRTARRHRALIARLGPPEPMTDHAEHFDDGIASAELRKMSIPDQRVIALCVIEGLSEREAAEVLNVPAGTVKSRLSRARRRLADRVVAELAL